MDANFLADRILAHVQAAAGAVDAAVTVVSLFPAATPLARMCKIRIRPEAQAVRIRLGTAPTAAIGYPIAVGETYETTDVTNLANLQIIAQAAGAIVNMELIAN